MQQATDLARQMVTRWGISEKFGPVTLAQRDDPFLRGDGFGGCGSSPPYNEATPQGGDDEGQRILPEGPAARLRLPRGPPPAPSKHAPPPLDDGTAAAQEDLRRT